MSSLENTITSPQPQPTIVSASGKVLIAGGYLVLDQQYSGVVVSTSSRFYTAIKNTSVTTPGKENRIYVRSPQFKDAFWEFFVEFGQNDGTVKVLQPEGATKNKFVHIALQTTLKVISELKTIEHLKKGLAYGLDITIVGDNDFYSQRSKLSELGLEPRISSLAQIPSFTHTGVTLSAVHKTGLGSSAALVTSLVGSLLLHLQAVSSVSPTSSGSNKDTINNGKEEEDGARLTHAVSQAAHCLAQGKVGSGFDVAAAVYGSQRYTRFNPSVLSPLMEGDGSVYKLNLLPVLGTQNTEWDEKVKPFQLPPGTRLMLADVDAGSDTPSLVGKVLKWHKAAGSEAVAFWDKLSASNNALADSILQLSELHSRYKDLYNAVLTRLTELPAAQWGSTSSSSDVITETFINVHKHSEDIRAQMRKMGTLTEVPIEPPEQTELLDACISQPGVIAAGVPGAGGYDAVWVLVLSPDSGSGNSEVQEEALDTPLHRVERVWMGWKGLNVSPLTAEESFEKGLRREQVENVPGLAEVLRGSSA